MAAISYDFAISSGAVAYDPLEFTVDSTMVILETKRLTLRHFESLDCEALMAVFGDDEVMHFGPGVKTREWVNDWLRNCLENDYQKMGFGPWAAVEKTSARLIGYCGLFYYPDIGGKPEIEIGYRLARPYWGQGFATEAALAVREYSFKVLGLRRLIALIDPQNTASIRVAEKIGMLHEQDVMLEGYTHPDRVYSITKPL